MKIVVNFKTCLTLSLLLFFTTVSAFAQTDVTGKLKTVPKEDGTYLLHQEDGIQFFAVRAAGKIQNVLVKDKQNRVIPASESESKVNKRANTISTTTNPISTAPPVTPSPCTDGENTICRWIGSLNRCMCIYTGPLN
jgi:hypothetical protein